MYQAFISYVLQLNTERIKLHRFCLTLLKSNWWQYFKRNTWPLFRKKSIKTTIIWLIIIGLNGALKNIISCATEVNFNVLQFQCSTLQQGVLLLFLMNCFHPKMVHSSCAVLLWLGIPKIYIFCAEGTCLGVIVLLGAWELYRLSRRADETCGWHYKSSLFAFLQPSWPFLERKDTIYHHKQGIFFSCR